MKERVVVLIFAHKEEPEWFERIALQQCHRILGGHPLRLVCPVGLDTRAYCELAPDLKVDFIPAKWMTSYRAYNQLKIRPFLYRKYSGFEYMLTYELDAFVFRDELLEWCAAGWDYIGAPWFVGQNDALPTSAPLGVGNSGFSLRRIAPLLRIMRSFRYQRSVPEIWRDLRMRNLGLRSAVAALTYRNNFFNPFNHFAENEDTFWCMIASGRFPSLRIAPWEAASRFAFENNPRRLYREIGNRLPFGCHKWMMFEPEFWSEHIAPLGYALP